MFFSPNPSFIIIILFTFHSPVDLDPASLPPLPSCPDGPAWKPIPPSGNTALVGTRPSKAAAAAAAATTPPPPEPAPAEPTPTSEPTALFAEATPVATEASEAASVEEEVEEEVGAEDAAPTATPTSTTPPTPTLAPPVPRPPPPPCSSAGGAAPHTGCLFAAGPGLLSSSSTTSKPAALVADAGGSVLVAWAPWCGGGSGNETGDASSSVALAASLEGDSDTPAGATITPMGALPGRPGTLLAAVATPAGWAGRVTVSVGGGEGGGGAPSLTYAVPPPASVAPRRAVAVTGVGLGGAVIVVAPGAED